MTQTIVVNIPSCYLIMKRNGKMLLFRRTHTGYKDGEYCLPAGHVETLETFLAATVREAYEEVGVTVSPQDVRHVHTMHRRSLANDDVRVDVFFETEIWSGEPYNAEPHKHGDPEWFPIDNPPPDTVDYILFALENIAQGKTYSEYGWDE